MKNDQNKKKIEVQETFITYQEMADMIGYSRRTLYTKLEENKIPHDQKRISPLKQTEILAKLDLIKIEK